MDPYGCQAHMRDQRLLWERWYTGFFISCAIAAVCGGLDSLACLVFIPAYAIWYFAIKAKHRSQYNLYYVAQDEILQTGESRWVPYDKERLKLIDQNPLAVWP
jgi:hypothetical protein